MVYYDTQYGISITQDGPGIILVTQKICFTITKISGTGNRDIQINGNNNKVI